MSWTAVHFRAGREDAVQLRILGITVLIGLAEFALVALYPARLPVWLPYEFSWFVYLASVLSVAWYCLGLTRTAAGERPSRWRQAAFLLGVGLIYAALQTHYDYAAQHMFFIHRGQHLVLHHTGPFLIALSNPVEMLMKGMPSIILSAFDRRWFHRSMAVLQQPLVATFLFVGLIYLWPAPPVHFYAMLDPRLYTVMNWSVTIDGILFWALMLDPRPSPAARLSFGVRALICIAIMFPQILLGAVVTFSERDLFEVYSICGRIIPMSGLEDQQWGGLILWIPGAMMSAVGALLILNFMRVADEKSGANAHSEPSNHAHI